MDYIGSKEKVNEWMFSKMLDGIDPKKTTFMDACAGSGSVSRYAVTKGFSTIISNDIMKFSQHLVRGSLTLTMPQIVEANVIISELNRLNGINGFFRQNYSEESGKLYFSNVNAAKIDAVRQEIEKITDPNIKSYLLYSGIEALSAVSNTTGIQAAFLKKLKARALKDFTLKPQDCIVWKDSVVYTKCADILRLLKQKSFRERFQEDLLYIDPPYNSRQYGPNYHLYETFVRYDNPSISIGKTGLRDWKNESKSDFCSKKTCASFTKQIYDSTTAKHIYISYNSDGLLSKDEIISIFPEGTCELFEMDQRRYKADSSKDREYNETPLKEYLFKITK